MYFFSQTDILNRSYCVCPKCLCNQHWSRESKQKISIPLWTHRKVGENKIKKKLCVFGVFSPPPPFSYAWFHAGKNIANATLLKMLRYVRRLLECQYFDLVKKKRILYWIVMPVARWYFCSCLRCMSQKIQIIIW